MYETGIIVVAVVAMFVAVKSALARTVVFEYEKGVKFTRGRYAGIAEPGVHWSFRFATSIQKLDLRPQIASVAGQEVLSSDGVSIKVSVVAQFAVKDAYAALTQSTGYRDALYTVLQVALRELIGSSPIDVLLENKASFGVRLFEMSEAKVANLGLRLISADIKDVMFPGELKKMFADVVRAKKEGMAALEKARGESAALRHLANAAKMLDGNPNLLQLRLVQAISESSGSTVVLNATQSGITPVRTGGRGKNTEARKE